MKRDSKRKDSRHLKKSDTTPATKGRILVVNDEEPLREIVARMLTTDGYQCRTASDGLEALAVLDSEEFELLLSNLMMPKLDGLGLLERTKEKFPDMPVVLESAVHDISVALAFVRNGAYDYLLEPFNREQLLAVVHRALEYRRLRLESRNCQKKLGALTVPTDPKLERILVQDDEEPIREIIASMLTSSHYECRGVASPKEVLDILGSGEQFELVLCGLLETHEEGFFECMSEHFPDIPLVVLSACHSEVALFMEALRKGAYDYLPKPFEFEQLLNVVHRALEYRSLKLENRAYLGLLK